ncbi:MULTISPECIES: hypothetical protein [Vibrio]|nr:MULTISPECIES: hypothetical protein [Vibrio]EGR7969100.1 hypothetical protein [Vibrio vulnificus]KJR30544.1 hypothetical protein UF06_09085 [Vibrio sp. S234-5]MBE4605797.1 hypothetical protein [Vibrio navarrensis]MDE1236942.1 hypothetical protein [Vibrio aestuarianus]MDE1247688.1 hypothetical protein [Vibrio aestuarianus]
MDKFEIRADENGIGSVLILKDSWSDNVLEYMLSNEIRALRLTDSFGFKERDISFISQLTFLKSLEIYVWDATGLKSLEALTQLEVLGLQCKSQQKIDFTRFSDLKVFKATWSKGLSSMFSLDSIRNLNLVNYPNQNLKLLSGMKNLEQLYLTSRKLETLDGIECLSELKLLDLYNCPFLVSLVGTEKCHKLKNIEIEACNRVCV